MSQGEETSPYIQATWAFLDPTTLPEEQLKLVRGPDLTQDEQNFGYVDVTHQVYDIRCMEEPPSLQEHGFTITKSLNPMTYEDFQYEDKVKDYGNQVKQQLKSMLGARFVYMHEMLVSRLVILI